MPCYSMVPRGMTEAERQAQVDAAIAELEQRITAGSVTVKVGSNGAVAFVGWTDRKDVADVCAYRKLSVSGSFALRQAVQRAEMLAGRSVDENVIAAGIHSHDGGSTWHPGH